MDESSDNIVPPVDINIYDDENENDNKEDLKGGYFQLYYYNLKFIFNNIIFVI